MSFAKAFFTSIPNSLVPDSVSSAVKAVAGGISKLEKSLETTAAGQIALLGMLSMMISPAAASAVVGAGVVAGSAALTEATVGFTLKLVGLKPGNDSVGVALTALPEGIDLTKSMVAFGSCLNFNGTVENAATIPSGMVVYSKEENGITGSVLSTLGHSFLSLVNGTCAQEMLSSILSGVTPTPVDPGTGSNTGDMVSELTTVMGTVFLGLVVTSVAAGFVSHGRQTAGRVVDADGVADPLLPAAPAAPAAPAVVDLEAGTGTGLRAPTAPEALRRVAPAVDRRMSSLEIGRESSGSPASGSDPDPYGLC